MDEKEMYPYNTLDGTWLFVRLLIMVSIAVLLICYLK